MNKWLMGLGVVVLAAGCGERTPAPSTPPLQGEAVGVASSPGRLSKGGGIFADDLGPETLDVSAYPGPIQGGYRLLQEKCSRCHSAARPLNSPFVEMGASEVAATKRQHPEWFQNEAVWTIRSEVWKRYTHRMAMKPRSEINRKEADAILAFLVYDGKIRKIGQGAASWKAHRSRLLVDFQKRFPETFELLYGEKIH